MWELPQGLGVRIVCVFMTRDTDSGPPWFPLGTAERISAVDTPRPGLAIESTP